PGPSSFYEGHRIRGRPRPIDRRDPPRLHRESLTSANLRFVRLMLQTSRAITESDFSQPVAVHRTKGAAVEVRRVRHAGPDHQDLPGRGLTLISRHCERSEAIS